MSTCKTFAGYSAFLSSYWVFDIGVSCTQRAHLRSPDLCPGCSVSVRGQWPPDRVSATPDTAQHARILEGLPPRTCADTNLSATGSLCSTPTAPDALMLVLQAQLKCHSPWEASSRFCRWGFHSLSIHSLPPSVFVKCFCRAKHLVRLWGYKHEQGTIKSGG